MGLIPTLFILGIDGAPRLWPMGIGASRPRAIQGVTGVPARVELEWDDAGRLIESRFSIRPEPAWRRLTYVWREEVLERIREFDPKLAELFGDEPATEEIWTWSGGRPVEVRNITNEDGSETTREDWAWSDDGSSLTVTESSDRVLARNRVNLDARGRLIHSVREYTIDGSSKIIDLEWTPDDRLIAVRVRAGHGPELVIGFRWDERGRLIAQTRSDMPGVDVWQYEYDEP
ncbi:MAG: hypothetical protein HOV81_19730 [Kofleriaceae bacterium]|nr:hypothetical protein [Kofleriaceae bacterium]